MDNLIATKTCITDSDFRYAPQAGLKMERHYTRDGVSPFDQFEYELRTSIIREPNGKVIFEMQEVEVPKTWTQVATDILAQKYFRKAGVPLYNSDGTIKLDANGQPVLGTEKSIKQVAHRLAGTWRYWGEKYGYFASAKDAQVFYEELVYMIINQMVAPNSPQWFNTGLNWAYGVNGPAQGHYYADPDTGEILRSADSYTHPQPHACFVQSVKDDLVNEGGIMDLWVREARLFKYGSGTGTNFSNLRGAKEPLAGGGTSSGLMSWLKIGDRAAGAIKSGGTTRRAAKMVILNVDHPDIEEFVNWKVNEEKKVAALIAQGYDSAYESEAYQTVSGQNSNNSVRVDQLFLEAVEKDGEWKLIRRTDSQVFKTLRARDLWQKIIFAAWACADPGIQYDTTVNDWHTCPQSGRINASNPCCITGDTLVAVADGRNAVKIKDLIGKEVPVYAYNHATGRTVISRMWNIGVKRQKAPIYRVILDNDSSFRATDDHLIMLRDGTYKKVYDLKKGESLMPFHSKVLAPAKNRTKRRYYWTGDGWQPQYRAIWNYARGPANQGMHIHHSDFNALNDSLENLVMIRQEDHDNIHSERIKGDANPARRLMNQQWRENISKALRGEKNPNFGHVYSEESRILMRAASAKRWASVSERERSGKIIKAALERARENGQHIGRPLKKIKLEKHCPVCRNKFETVRAEQLFCSLACRFSRLGLEMIGPKTWEKNRGKALSPIHRAKLSVSVSAKSNPVSKRRAALAALKNNILRAARLLLDNNLSLSITKWDDCRKRAVALGAKRVPASAVVERLFASDNQLLELAKHFNHKVVSVVFEGYEDVYDGTVDNHHNFAILTKSDSSCVPGHQNFSGIFIHNSEYMFLDDTACNLCSINLGKFFFTDSLTFDVDGFKYASRVWTVVLEISILMAQYPSEAIAEGSYNFRSLGLGYANIGQLLMTAGIPYDSPRALAFAGSITALMTAVSYATSAEMAKNLGTFPKYELNRNDMLRVIRNHRRATNNVLPEEYEKMTIKPLGIDPQYAPTYILNAAKEEWDHALALGEIYGYRNAQVTLLAPTGTIGLVMDCSTTGVEPDFALVKFKKLAGGGYFKIVNEAVPVALRTLGYNELQIEEILNYMKGHGSLQSAPFVNLNELKQKGFTEEEIAKLEKGAGSTFELAFLFNSWTLGEECMKRMGFGGKYKNKDFDLLRELGYKPEEIDRANEHVCGAMTIEGAPHLKPEHYAVFDTANRNGKKGERFIHYLGHIRMMAAVQPFLSGAISKTINMPNEATVEDVDVAYKTSWQMGLKAIAIYRDGCKMSQPLLAKSKSKTETKETIKKEAESISTAPLPIEPKLDKSSASATMKLNLDPIENRQYVLYWDDGNGGVEQKISQRNIQENYAHDGTSRGGKIYLHGEQRLLPYKRGGVTIKAKVAGQKVFLRTGEYPDGRLGELFIDMYREGASFRSLLNLFAISVSIGLQYGVPLEEYVDKFTFTRFEPSGMTDHPNVKFSTSVVDFVFRVLGMEYLGRMDFVQVKPKGIQKHRAEKMALSTEDGQKTLDFALKEEVSVAVAKPTEVDAVEKQLSGMMGDAPPCPTCGHITIRNGSCYKCLNCGSTTGCS